MLSNPKKTSVKINNCYPNKQQKPTQTLIALNKRFKTVLAKFVWLCIWY